MLAVVVCNEVSVGCGGSFVKIFLFFVKFVIRWGVEWGCLGGVVRKLGDF